MKSRRAGGPDGTIAEFYKYLDSEIRDYVLELLNMWWTQRKVDYGTMRARIAHIFKKGNTALFKNYRPISLLNTIYKVYTRIIHQRMSSALDHLLHLTQSGFRKHRGTHHAIHIVRRLLEAGESSTNKLIILLLDWEQAFDKISHEGLSQALQRSIFLPSTLTYCETCTLSLIFC